MTWTSPATPVGGTPITVSFYNTNVRDNLNHLRGMLPDISTAGELLISTGVNAAGWSSTKPTQLIINRDLTVVAGSYADAHLQVTSGPNAAWAPQIGFHRQGIEGAALYYANAALHFIRHSGVTATIAERIPGRIVGWNASSASIPSGHLLHTALLDRFPIAANNTYAFGASGGTVTHDHGSINTAHDHSMQGHTHSGTTDNNNADENGQNGTGSAWTSADSPHTHTMTTGGPSSANTASGGGSIATAAANHLPPYLAITFMLEV